MLWSCSREKSYESGLQRPVSYQKGGFSPHFISFREKQAVSPPETQLWDIRGVNSGPRAWNLESNFDKPGGKQ